MVEELPEHVLFNVALYDRDPVVVPFSRNCVLATDENKRRYADWISTVNPLNLEESFADGFDRVEGLWKRLYELDWEAGECLTNNVAPCGPKWLYHYVTSEKVNSFYSGASEYRDFYGLPRAVAFGLEQKPDTIFILSPAIWGSDAVGERDVEGESALADLKSLARYVYREDTSKIPQIQFIMYSRIVEPVSSDTRMNAVSAFTYGFGGEVTVVHNIRDFMSKEEWDQLQNAEGTD